MSGEIAYADWEANPEPIKERVLCNQAECDGGLHSFRARMRGRAAARCMRWTTHERAGGLPCWRSPFHTSVPRPCPRPLRLLGITATMDGM